MVEFDVTTYVGLMYGGDHVWQSATGEGHWPGEPMTSSRLRGVVGCRWHRTGYAGNKLGRPLFSSGQQRADMMMMMMPH